MDINNIEQENAVKKKKIFKDIDIRDVIHYLVTKSWVIVIVVAICLVGAILYTAFITPTYQSTSSMLIITDEGSTVQDFGAGQKIINNTPAVIKENVFCEKVAKMLNNNSEDNQNGKLDTYKEFLNKNPSLVQALGGNSALDYNITAYTNGKALTADTIRSSLSVKISKDAENTFSVTATTTNPKLSAIIANAVTAVYEEYVKDDVVTKGTNISTNIYQKATIAQKASNKSYPKNVAIAVAAGFVASCAVLFLIFFFDDKIKTPDDITKHLELNILGTIPDFEER